MSKTWAEKVADKLTTYNKRISEINKSLSELNKELDRRNLRLVAGLADEKNLVWEIQINSQTLYISEEDIAQEQIVTKRDEYGERAETGEKLDIKEALQNIILKNLKTF